MKINTHIFKTPTQQNQSVWLSACIFFFLLPHLNLSERPCFWLTDLQPHLVTRSCCQHSFPEKSSCQTTLPWSTAKTEKEWEGGKWERERASLLRLANCCGDRKGTQPIRSRVTRLTSLWWKKETETEPEWDRRMKRRNTKHVFSKKWVLACSKCSPAECAAREEQALKSVAQKSLTVYCLHGWPAHAHFEGSYARGGFRLSVKSLGPLSVFAGRLDATQSE